MPVDDMHQGYLSRTAQWMRCRDAVAGNDAVKGKTTTYLPRLGNQKDDEYQAYVMRACWYGATGRTVLGLTGSVMRKDPVAEVPESMKEHLEDVTETNVTLATFAGSVVQEVLNVGRCGILLDMPEMAEPGMPRPHWVQYHAEQIRNWRCEMLAGVKTLTMAVLQEEFEQPGKDQFSYECVTQYRVLRLIGGQYVVDLYRPDPNKPKEFVLVNTLVPVVRGVTIPYIPFVFVNALNLDPMTDKPPLLDLVDVNFSHYRNSADLEHGRHFTALPTPYVTGMAKDKTGSFHIGSSTAWCIPQAEAKVGMLEFTGQGLGALEKALESKERQMAVLGARMLEEQKLQTEATETHAIRRSGESSLLASIAETISAALTQIATWHAGWVGVKTAEPAKVMLNKDFFGIPLSPTEIAELVKSWQAGAISYETLYYNLEQGEVTRPGVSAEDEQAQIENETPPLDLGSRSDKEPELEEEAAGKPPAAA